MCGILVVKSKNITKNLKQKFISSIKFLKNRGPDETRIIQKNNFLIGFTRLSINDLKTASQPYESLCKRYIIVFNGEAVNYKDLADDLKKKKITLQYGHEAEVIINLFILYGNSCVKFIRGFFSFVIIDTKFNNIFAAVDRFSIKPLYYSENYDHSEFVLSSDYSAILKGGLMKKKINFNKVVDYFSMAREFDNKTIISNVKKLGYSSTLLLTKNNLRISKYWHPFQKNYSLINNRKDLIEKLHYKFLDVINYWKIADIKVSLCLSTGLDSQIINAYLNINKLDFTNFHIIERKKIPENLRNSNRIKIDAKKIIYLVNRFAKENLNPFAVAHSSSTGLFQLYSTIAKNKFKLTLNGEGSDEIFGGYLRYNRQLKYVKYNKLSLSDAILKVYKNEIQLLSSVLSNKNFDLKKNLKKKISSIKLRSSNFENKFLEFDQLTWIPSLIQRHDVIGMHYGLEVRPPYLDHELVELANSLPFRYKFNTTNKNKIILNDLIYRKFKVTINNKKISTPSGFDLILKDKKEIKSFKDAVAGSEISKYFNLQSVVNLIDNPYKNKIFLWRMYILSKMLNNF